MILFGNFDWTNYGNKKTRNENGENLSHQIY